MFEIDNNNIRITRGDYALVTIDPLTVLNSHEVFTYFIGEYDYFVLTVSKSIHTKEPLIKLILDQGCSTFELLPSHTENLEFGNYRYDLKLYLGTGEQYTVIPDSLFKVTPVIGLHSDNITSNPKDSAIYSSGSPYKPYALKGTLHGGIKILTPYETAIKNGFIGTHEEWIREKSHIWGDYMNFYVNDNGHLVGQWDLDRYNFEVDEFGHLQIKLKGGLVDE